MTNTPIIITPTSRPDEDYEPVKLRKYKYMLYGDSYEYYPRCVADGINQENKMYSKLYADHLKKNPDCTIKEFSPVWFEHLVKMKLKESMNK